MVFYCSACRELFLAVCEDEVKFDYSGKIYALDCSCNKMKGTLTLSLPVSSNVFDWHSSNSRSLPLLLPLPFPFFPFRCIHSVKWGFCPGMVRSMDHLILQGWRTALWGFVWNITTFSTFWWDCGVRQLFMKDELQLLSKSLIPTELSDIIVTSSMRLKRNWNWRQLLRGV